jgi:DnaK suppressor protein
MKSFKTNQVKNKLLQHLGDLNRNSNEVLERCAKTSDKFSDTLDQANFQSEMDFTFYRLLREGSNRENILRALQKIDEGSYGICEMCEEEISSKRLKAIPYARHCITCQTHLENEEALVEGLIGVGLVYILTGYNYY